MAEPVIAATEPCLVALVKDKRYAWCRCGRSARQPYCDRSHAGSGLTPLVFRARRTGKSLLCTCKRTAKPPYCDGSHEAL